MWDMRSSRLVLPSFSAVVVTLMICIAAGTARAQNELARFEGHWKNGDYAKALPELIDYRGRTRERTPQLDYMIATSACRTTDNRQTGSEFFSWILYNYNLSSQNRALIEAERRRCSTSAPPTRLRAMSPASLVGVTYSGKGGTRLQAESSGNGTTEVVAAVDPETLVGRLFEPSAWKTALSRISALVGPNYDVEHVGYFILAAPAARRRASFPDSPDSQLPAHLEIPSRDAIPNKASTPAAGAPASTGAIPNAAAIPNSGPPLNVSQFPNAAVAPNGPPPPLNVSQIPNSGAIPGNSATQSVDAVRQSSPQSNPGAIQNSMVVQSAAQGPASTDSPYLKHVGDDLERYMRFFVSEYGMRAPPRLITVYFTRNVDELSYLARRLHGIELAPGSIGYSFPADQSMAGWADGKAYGTFAHELFHVMARQNFGDIPPWLDEGMASLYEVSRFEGNRAVGVTNWRGEILTSLWRMRPSLGELVQMDRSAFDVVDGTASKLVAGEKQAVNHATARYFMLYLQERHQLQPLYRAFLNRKVSDQPGLQAVELVESVIGHPLAQVDQDFAHWFRSLQH